MNKELPTYASTSQIGAPRIKEIKALEKELAKCKHGVRAFQKLPRHMQRRAVSSNPQRLPRSLQEKHKREIGILKVCKRPSRKYRRRPSNLLLEYNRRQRNNVWLETHIWHAKRFHMTKRWGYFVPKTPTSKCFRSTLRAATDSCLMQDVSFENCIECEGPVDELTAAISKVVSSEDIIALREPQALKGCIWVNVMFYAPDKLPYEAIGNGQLIWIPSDHTEANNLYRLWIFIHPSIYEDVYSTLNQLLDLETVNMVVKDSDGIKSICENNHILDTKLLCKNVPWERIPKFKSKYYNIKVALLKDTLNKFRLVGPKSYYVLKKAIISSSVSLNTENIAADILNKMNESGSVDWWKTVFANSNNLNANKEQISFWESLVPQSLKSKHIISFVMRDPRLVLPVKKQPIEDEVSQSSHQIEHSKFHQPSEIFNPEIRDNVTFSMKSTHEINNLRSKLLVPGVNYPVTDQESRIPILLLHCPSSHVSGLGSGWELILPCGWGMPTWLTLIMNGAVAGGQDEAENLMAEFLSQPLPQFLPDCKAGQKYSSLISKQKEDDYFKRPPNCRLNFIKLGICDPFKINWEELVKYWNEGQENFFCLRNAHILKRLVTVTCRKINKINTQESRKRFLNNTEDQPDSKYLKIENWQSVKPAMGDHTHLSIPGNSLIYVRIILIAKGSLQSYAMICLPTEEDLHNLNLKLKESGNESLNCITEPSHEDTNIELRRELKEKHQKNLKRLQRKRKKARSAILNCEDDPLKKYSSLHEALEASTMKVEQNEKELMEEIQTYNSKMNKLWSQSQTEVNKLQFCSRSIIGYITNGGFCVRMGRSGGVGWVVAKPLSQLLVQSNISCELDIVDDKKTTQNDNSYNFKQVFVLVRNPSSYQYLWARLVVLNL